MEHLVTFDPVAFLARGSFWLLAALGFKQSIKQRVHMTTIVHLDIVIIQHEPLPFVEWGQGALGGQSEGEILTNSIRPGFSGFVSGNKQKRHPFAG